MCVDEARTRGGQAVDTGRGDAGGAVAGKVTESEVIGHEQDDIGAFRSLCGCVAGQAGNSGKKNGIFQFHGIMKYECFFRWQIYKKDKCGARQTCRFLIVLVQSSVMILLEINGLLNKTEPFDRAEFFLSIFFVTLFLVNFT